MLQEGSAEGIVTVDDQCRFGAPEGPAIPVAGFSRLKLLVVMAHEASANVETRHSGMAAISRFASLEVFWEFFREFWCQFRELSSFLFPFLPARCSRALQSVC